MNSRRRITINKLAEKAGVSKTAVSFAFNNPSRISKTTRERILRIADEYGYVPDPVARTLATRKVGSIGFLIPQSIPVAFKNPFLSQVLQGIGSVCQKEGFSLTVVPPLKGCILKGIRSAAVDGFVTFGLEAHLKIVELIRQRNIPLVVVDGKPSESIPSVNTDDLGGAKKIMEYVLSLGHRRIVILSLKSASKVDQENFSRVRDLRLKGYEDALESFGLKIDGRNVKAINCECSMAGGRKAAEKIFTLKKRPTAIVAMSDIIAIGVFEYCREHGIKIPEDISLAGFDNIPEASLITPALTTVSQSAFEKGLRAGEILIDLLHGRKTENFVEFKTDIIVRNSVAVSRP